MVQDQGEKIRSGKRVHVKKSALPLTFDLKIKMQLSSYILLSCTLLVKSDQDWVKERENMAWTRLFHYGLL